MKKPRNFLILVVLLICHPTFSNPLQLLSCGPVEQAISSGRMSPSIQFSAKIPKEKDSLALLHPEIAAWVMTNFDRSHAVPVWEFFDIGPRETKKQALEKVTARLDQFFNTLEGEIFKLGEELKREKKFDDITDPRFIMMRELEGIVRENDYLKLLLANPKVPLPKGMRISEFKMRRIEEIRNFFGSNPDGELTRDERDGFIYKHFHFLKTTWSELAVFSHIENALHVSSDVFALKQKTVLELSERALKGEFEAEFDVIGIRADPVRTMGGVVRTRSDGRPELQTILVVGEVKMVNGPLGLTYGDGKSVVENLKKKRRDAQKTFDSAIEYRIYSPSGFTRELALELAKNGFVMVPDPRLTNRE